MTFPFPVFRPYGGNDSFTKVLLHFDGADGSTAFTDVAEGTTPHTFTATGDAQIDTAQSVFGGASGLFDGTGDYISAPDSPDWDLGTQNFVIEFRLRPADTSAGLRCILIRETGAVTASFAVYQSGTGIEFYASANTGVGFDISNKSMGTLAAGTWSHFAVVRSGNDFTCLQDGVQVGSATTASITLENNNKPMQIGSDGSFHYNGHIDELRLSVGTDRGWGSGFIVPSSAYF